MVSHKEYSRGSRTADSPGAKSDSPQRQRRYLTILFSDLSDSMRLAETMEAEHYAELLNALRQACRQIIPQHGGRIAQLLGDGVLAVFGYPEPHEGDGRRATEAALELHAAAKRLRVPTADGAQHVCISLHSGIHSGLVLLGEGDAELGRFELLGSTPNIAARLSSAARRDEIVVSAETLGPESYCFETSKMQHLTVKGATAPIAVYCILARAGVHTRYEASTHRGLAAFVGRQMELRDLEQHLESLSAGRRVLAISAAAGMGKTRLAEEFLKRAAAANSQVHRGYCESSLGAAPLQPFLHMLRSLFGIQPDDSPEHARQFVALGVARIDQSLTTHESVLLRLLSVTRDAALSSADATAALTALFTRLAAVSPQVIYIDDWQWADDATRQVFRAMVGLAHSPILLLLSTRQPTAHDVDLGAAQSIEIAPFTKEETLEVVSRLLPGVAPFTIEEIFRYSGGNPLFIEELCHSAVHDGSRRLNVVQRGAAWLNMLIESRLARLPQIQADLVRAAATIGNLIPSWLFESVTGHSADDPLVRRLAEEDFIFPGDTPGTLRFKHGITRDVIYSAIGLHERTEMHRRIAATLEQHSASGTGEEAYELLAYHYGAGEQAEQAAHFAELAGNKAVAASALDRAKTQYRAALTALDKLKPSPDVFSRWPAIAQRFGLACVFDPSREDLEVFQRACKLGHASGDLPTIARAEYWMGYISYALGDSRPALHHCERALQVARRIGDDPFTVQIRATLGQVHAASCDYGPAVELLDEAIAIKRKHRTGARPAVGLAYSLVCRAQAFGDRGEFAKAHECFEEALVAVRGSVHEVEASILGWRAAILLWQGHWAEAKQTAEAAYRIGERVRSLFSFSMSHAAGAYARWMLERSATELAAIENATSWLEPHGVGLFQSLNFGWLADGLTSSGRHTDARRYAARALRRARQRDLLGVPMAYRALAHIAINLKDYRRAEQCLDRAAQVANIRDSPHERAVIQFHRAQLAFALEQRLQARDLLAEAATEFDRMDMRWHFDQAQGMSRWL